MLLARIGAVGTACAGGGWVEACSEGVLVDDVCGGGDLRFPVCGGVGDSLSVPLSFRVGASIHNSVPRRLLRWWGEKAGGSVLTH